MQGALIGGRKNKIRYDQHIDEKKMGPGVATEDKAVDQDERIIDEKKEVAPKQREMSPAIQWHRRHDQKPAYEVEKGDAGVTFQPIKGSVEFNDTGNNQRNLIADTQAALFSRRTLSMIPYVGKTFPNQCKCAQGMPSIIGRGTPRCDMRTRNYNNVVNPKPRPCKHEFPCAPG